MSRQETNNIFNEGLIKDLNPINTPNTALTDCVNGTIITYDGNEYSLQNDKGNYALEHCKLDSNYIPVGVKEYGDILYIVSYNPLNEHVQIGSYPSPKTITDAKEWGPLPDDGKVINIYEALKNSGEKSFSYQEIVKTYSKLHIFYGANPDELKMHEGDEIKLTVNGASTNPFEKLQYVLVDGNRQITDISDKVSDFINIGKHKPIAWGPGWFGFKPVIAEISDNTINIKRIKVPSYGTGNASLVFNTRISTSDPLLADLSKEMMSRLKVEVKLTGNEGESIFSKELPLDKKLNLKNGIFYYYSKDKTISSELDVTKYSSITLTTTPILYLDDNIRIVYDHLKKSSVFNLSTKGNPENFSLGEICWNWKTDTKNNNIALTFDTVGLSPSSVLDSDVFLKYSITGLDGTTIIDNNNNSYTDVTCSEWNINGDTTIEFETTPFTEENYQGNPNRLYTENIYKIIFEIIDESGESIKKFAPKTIVATELLNSASTLKYDNISIDTWLDNYISSIKNTTFDINHSTVGNWNISSRYNPQNYNIWTKPSNIFRAGTKTYSTFISDTDMNDVKESDYITWTAKCNLSIECKSNITLLTGPMWIDFNDNCQVQFNNKTIKFNKFTGKLLGSCSIDIEGISTKSIPCNLVSSSQNNIIWNYDEGNPTYRELELTIDGYHNQSSNTKTIKLIFKLKSGSNVIWTKSWPLTYVKDTKSSYDVNANTIVDNILAALKNDDLGLVKVNVGTINERNNYCSVGLWKTTESGNEDPLLNNDGRGGWDFNHAYMQFLVIKLNNDALFVKIPNTEWTDSEDSKEGNGISSIEKFCSEVNCLKTLSTFSTEGGFWKMILGEATIKDSTSVSINGSLSFPSELKVSSYNLLDKTNIPEGLSLTPEQYAFKSLSLKPNKESIDIKADFSSTDNDESVLRASVENRNNLIDKEISDYAQNEVYRSGFNSGILYKPGKVDFQNTNVLINYMNEKVHSSNTILYGRDYYSDNGRHGIIERRIGKLAIQELS